MSTLSVDTIEDRSASQSVDATYVVHGTVKSYVNYTSVTTTAASDSLNVTSLTDNGSGDTDINFTNNFDSTGYGQVVGTGSSSGATNVNVIIVASSDKLAGAARCIQGNPSTTTATDTPNGSCVCLGDLA